MNRKLLLFIIVVAILAAGIAGYFYYLSQQQESNVDENVTGPLQIKKVSDEPTISPVGSFDNNTIWYFNSSGRLFKANVDGTNLSEYPLPTMPGGNLMSIIWPKSGSDFISISRNGSLITKNYYEAATKLFIGLADNVQWVEWLPDGKRVLYIWQSDDRKSQQLVMANADGAGFKTIASVFWPDLALKVDPTGKTVLMYRTTVQGDVNKIYAANVDTGVVSTIIDTGKNTSAMWLPVGNKFLFVQNSNIMLYDMLNRQATDLKLNTTIDKVAADASGKVLYAAVLETTSSDKFVKVNLSSGQTETYFDPSADIKVKSLLLVGSTVYFVDARDNKLYMVSR